MATLRRVLVATDLSETGNRAVGYGYAIVAPGGRVDLLHVVEPVVVPNPLYAHYTPGRTPTAEARRRQHDALATMLRALVPADAADRDVSTVVEIVEHDQVERAICEAAKRLGADVVCLGSHGRSALRAAIAGSIALHVMTHAGAPLLVIPGPA